jgi:hypothetical protein
MKKLVAVTLLAISFNSMANNPITICAKDFGTSFNSASHQAHLVDQTCVVRDLITTTNFNLSVVEKFLALEKEIGEKIFDANHVNNLQIYATKYSNKFSRDYVTSSKLTALGHFGIKQLGVYDISQDLEGWDMLDMFRDAVVTDAKGLKTFLQESFLKNGLIGDDYYDQDDVLSLEPQIREREALYDEAISQLINLLTTKGSVTIYPLLDNQNENIQDAQWIVVGSGQMIILNRFWYL